MLDSNARKFVQPFIASMAKLCISLKLSATNVTCIAFFIGLSSSLWLFLDLPIIALITLWFSGFLDAVDGTIARITNTSSPWGTILDLIFDRFVELGIIFVLAFLNPHLRMHFIFLLAAILFSMCVFLSVGALSTNNSVKSFRYQAGVMERTEGFICFSLMMIFNNHLVYIVIFTTILIAFTACQRLREAKKLLSK